MTYRASIGGAFGGGAGSPAVHPIDIGGAIDSLTNGASTLIQNAYVRKQAASQMAMRQQQQDMERQRYEQTNAREAQHYADEKEAKAAAVDRQKQNDALTHEFRMGQLRTQGLTPGSTTISRQPDAPAPAVQAPPIAQAFSQGNLSAGAPPAPTPLTTPVQEGSFGTVPHLNVTTTPETFDPSQSLRGYLGDKAGENRLDVAGVNTAGRLNVAALRTAAQERIARGHDDLRKTLAADLAASKAANGGKPITDAQRGAMVQRAFAHAMRPTESLSGGLGMTDKDAALEFARGSVEKMVAGSAHAAKDAAPADESKVTDADLWEQKVKSGMSKAAATKYVQSRKH